MVLRRATKPGDECDVHEWRRYLLWYRGEVRAVKRRTNRRERREADQDVRGHGLRAGDWDSDEDTEWDTTEAEFDAMMERGEPVEIVGSREELDEDSGRS